MTRPIEARSVKRSASSFRALFVAALAMPFCVSFPAIAAAPQSSRTRPLITMVVGDPQASRPANGDRVTWSEAVKQVLDSAQDTMITFAPPLPDQTEIVIPLPETPALSLRAGALEIDASASTVPVILDASGCESCAFVVAGKAALILRNVTIRGAGQRNILLKDQASLRMERTTLADSQGPGLVLYGEATGELIDCWVTANQTHGIELHDRAVLSVIDGRITENRQAGVAAFQDSRVTLKGAIFDTSGQWHLFLTDGARAALLRCRMAGAAFAGMDLSQSAEAELRDCLLSGSKRFGVFATGRSRIRMAGTQIRQAAYRGLELQDETVADFDHCRVESCGDYGGIFFGRSRMDARSSAFSYNGAHAISLREQAAGTFNDCTFAGNRYSGIGCLDGRDGGRVMVRRSVFQANGMRPLYRGPFHLDPAVPTPLRIRNDKVVCRADPGAQIDLFLDQAGEAAEYLQSLQADEAGTFEVSCQGLPPGRVITASATANGATSEFNVVAGAENEPLLAALLGQTGPLSDNSPAAQSDNRPRRWHRGAKLIFRLSRAPSPTVERYARTFTADIDTWTNGAVHGSFQTGPPTDGDPDSVVIPVHYMPADDPQLEGVGGVTLMRWTLDGYFVRPMEIMLAEGGSPQECCPRILAHEMGHTLGLGHARVGLLSRMQGALAPADPRLVNDFSPTLTFYDVQALGLLYGSQHRSGMSLAELIPDYATSISTTARRASDGRQPTFSPQPPEPPVVSRKEH